jgi:outer membrane protein OmpA-like peptidoglycan-associated protein
MENNPFVGVGGGLTYNYELAFDVSVASIALGLNMGFRDRNPGEPVEGFPIQPLEDQYIASAAASYHFSSINTKLIFEVFGSQPVEKVQTEIFRKQSSAEALLGIKYDASDSVAIHFGGGSELNNSIGSPDYRIYTGINVALGPMFEDKPKIVKAPEPPPTPAAPPAMAEVPEVPIKEEAGPGDEVFVLKDINFVFDSYQEVLSGAKNSMAEIADRIIKKNFRLLIIEGHTDSMGSDEYNMKLGARRAIAVRDYLVKVHGLDRSKIRAVTLGESKPIADNGNYQGRQANRRVVFRVFYE